jgi:hypothetical protein
MKRLVLAGISLAALGLGGAHLLRRRHVAVAPRSRAPDRSAEVARNLLLYFVVPLWTAAGAADWLCHRRGRIEETSGIAESLLHLLMLAEVGVPVVAAILCEIRDVERTFARFVRNGETVVLVRVAEEAAAEAAIDTLRQYARSRSKCWSLSGASGADRRQHPRGAGRLPKTGSRRRTEQGRLAGCWAAPGRPTRTASRLAHGGMQFGEDRPTARRRPAAGLGYVSLADTFGSPQALPIRLRAKQALRAGVPASDHRRLSPPLPRVASSSCSDGC